MQYLIWSTEKASQKCGVLFNIRIIVKLSSFFPQKDLASDGKQ